MRQIGGISSGKARLLSGPGDLCGICLRRNRARLSKTSTAERDWSSALRRQTEPHSFRRRTMLVVSAKQFHRRDAGIRQIFHQQHPGKRRRRDAGRRLFFPARPASRSSPARPRARRMRFEYFAKTRFGRVRQAATGIARRFRASHSRRSGARSISDTRFRDTTMRY